MAQLGQQQQRVAGELEQHQSRCEVGQQMHRRLELVGGRPAAAEHRGQQLEGGLEAAGRPARLLASICVDSDRELLGNRQTLDEDGSPAGELGPVAQVQVLGQGVGGPAPGLHDRGSPPDAGGPREVGQVTGAGPHRLLHPEVEIDHQGLESGENRVVPVQVFPARLHEADVGFPEPAHRLAQEVRGGQEVRVEDGDQLGRGPFQPEGKGAGLVAIPAAPTKVSDPNTPGTPVTDALGDDPDRLVVRVVQHLDLKPVAWPIEAGDRVDDPLSDVPLVVDGELDGYLGLVARHRGRGGENRQP